MKKVDMQKRIRKLEKALGEALPLLEEHRDILFPSAHDVPGEDTEAFLLEYRALEHAVLTCRRVLTL